VGSDRTVGAVGANGGETDPYRRGDQHGIRSAPRGPDGPTTSSIRRRATAAITSTLATVVLATVVLAALVVAAPTPAAAAPRQAPADPAGAYLLRDGRFVPLGGVPGASATIAGGINDHGQIAGTWVDRPETPTIEPGTRHGVVWDRGRLTRFDVPGSLVTGALGINNAGHVTGSYDDAAGRHHGFVLRRGRYTTIDAPGRMVTDAWGINDRGQVVIPDLGTGLAPVTR
jgi:uncharacterized membrane protein